MLSSPCSARTIFQKFSPIWFPAYNVVQRVQLSSLLKRGKKENARVGDFSYLASLHVTAEGARTMVTVG